MVLKSKNRLGKHWVNTRGLRNAAQKFWFWGCGEQSEEVCSNCHKLNLNKVNEFRKTDFPPYLYSIFQVDFCANRGMVLWFEFLIPKMWHTAIGHTGIEKLRVICTLGADLV